MKRAIIFLLSLCLCFFLSACGVSQADYDSLAEENSSLQSEVESLESEKETHEESTLNENSNEITSGDFYDSVTAIHSNVSIVEIEDGVSVSIFLEHENELVDSTMFFDVINQIIETSKMEEYYSSATFMMFVDESLTAMLTIIDYASPTSFVSTDPIVINQDYVESIDTLYSIAFSSNDVMNNFDKSLDEIREKYNAPK